jgi:hypothetical protein
MKCPYCDEEIEFNDDLTSFSVPLSYNLGDFISVNNKKCVITGTGGNLLTLKSLESDGKYVME